jgi:16S rRNA (cytosine1402-N4)-methyltransferase
MNSDAESSEESAPKHQRRIRYKGKNPRHFSQKYKELKPELYPETIQKVIASGKTPAGAHIPIMVEECLSALAVKTGQIGVDATLGYGGHAKEILTIIGKNGKLLGLDTDSIELPKTSVRLREAGFGETVFEGIQTNYAGIPKVLVARNLLGVDFILADLGCSSMQIDDPKRGFTFKTDGPLDMRMNPQRGISAADFIEKTNVEKLAFILKDYSDETNAELIAKKIVGQRFDKTSALVKLLDSVVKDESQNTIRRVFQALRIAVNEEFTALDTFLRNLPASLKSGGRVAILTFHSGEDRRVKKAFQQFHRDGIFSEISENVIIASESERHRNPRSTSAKLRWAQIS